MGVAGRSYVPWLGGFVPRPEKRDSCECVRGQRPLLPADGPSHSTHDRTSDGKALLRGNNPADVLAHRRVPEPASSTHMHSPAPLRGCGCAHSVLMPNTTIDIFRHLESVKSSLARANSHAQPRPNAMCEHKEAFSFQHFE